MHRTRVLVSGFVPFLDEKVNPSQLLATHVNTCAADGRWKQLDVRGVVLPVVFGGHPGSAFHRLLEEIAVFTPDIVLSFGLAAGRKGFGLETLAVNQSGGDQAARGDNDGQTRRGVILSDEPQALRSTLPLQKMLDALHAAGIAASLSPSAGNYVCNELFFRTQARFRFSAVRSGFVHIPRLRDDDDIDVASGLKWGELELGLDAILGVFASEPNLA